MNHYQLKNETGSVLVIFLTSLPILLSLMAFLVFNIMSIYLKSQSLNHCRINLIQSQKELGQNLNALLELNPRAKSLRIARKIADYQYKVALMTLNPAVIAAAKAYIFFIKANQHIINFQQKTLLLKSRFLVTKTKWSLRRKLKDLSKINNFYIIHPSLQVKASPKRSLSPNYELTSTGNKSHFSQARWTYPIASFLPRWIQNIAPVKNLKLSGSCQTTLIKDKGQWIAIFQRDKLSWKH